VTKTFAVVCPYTTSMTEQTNNDAQVIEEGFANNLKDEKVQDHDVNQPRQILVDAFIEETEIEDELRKLIRRVATRLVAVGTSV
jgi:Flp pilus assembly CpaF family ATPase